MSKTIQLSDNLLLRTKLRRPLVPGDFVYRPRLNEMLDRSMRTPTSLVSAPAGYGKSVLVSGWMEYRDELGAWLSLDSSDSELDTFLDYLLATVATIFPDACPRTHLLMRAPERPPMGVLANCLANELDALETPFIMVLDDYHFIQAGSAVHELMRRLMAHPIQPLHLVICYVWPCTERKLRRFLWSTCKAV